MLRGLLAAIIFGCMFSVGGAGEPIKDPEKARLRAQYLMRQVVIEVDGRIRDAKIDGKGCLDEIIKTCPDTPEAARAKLYLKHIERMDAALKEKPDPKAKPLVLGEILERQISQKRELAEALRGGNENAWMPVKLDHYVERAKWKGKQVAGEAQVIQVSGGNVYAVVKVAPDPMAGKAKGKKTTETSRSIWLKISKDDALLGTLKKGNVVQFQGALENHGYPPEDRIVIKDASLGQKN